MIQVSFLEDPNQQLEILYAIEELTETHAAGEPFESPILEKLACRAFLQDVIYKSEVCSDCFEELVHKADLCIAIAGYVGASRAVRMITMKQWQLERFLMQEVMQRI